MNDHEYGEKLGDQHMKPVSVSRLIFVNPCKPLTSLQIDLLILQMDDKMKLGKDGKKGKRKKTSNVKRPTTAYLYFVSKYREKIKAAGEPMPKVGFC